MSFSLCFGGQGGGQGGGQVGGQLGGQGGGHLLGGSLPTLVFGEQLSPQLILTSMTSPPILTICETSMYRVLLSKNQNKPLFFLAGR